MTWGTEFVLSEAPFIVRRQVRWGDCDPAGVVYTGRFPEYVLGAVSLFMTHISGGGMIGERFDVATPCKAMNYEFLSALWPQDIFDIECFVGELRTRSFDIHCVAAKPDGTPVFNAVFSPICMRRDARVGVPIPDGMRELLKRYARVNVP